MKRIILLLTSCLISAMSFAEIIDSGTDGNITWTFDDEGTLTISGEGDIPDFLYDSFNFAKSIIKRVVVEDGITSIGQYAFSNALGGSNFYYSNMNSIKLPNTLKTIKQDAFSYCDSLTEIEIPASVTNFNYRAIADCSDLQTITVNWQEPPLLTDYHFGKMDLELRTLIVPAGTKEIYEQAEVWNRFQIIEQLPDNIIASGDLNETIRWTLDSDSTLTISGTGDMPNYEYYSYTQSWRSFNFSILRIVIEEGITNVGKYTIAHCDNLESIVIPNTVETIEFDAITYNQKLTAIHIPSSVKNINSHAFSMNISLNSIIVSENNESYSSLNGILYNKDKSSLLFYPMGKTDKHFAIPSSVTTLGEEALSSTHSLQSIYIPNSVKTIENNAIRSGFELKSIIIDNEMPPINHNLNFPNSSSTGAIPNNCNIFVPENSITTYANNSDWAWDENYLPIINSEITPDALISWQAAKDATGYQLIILSDESHNDTLRIINFDADGIFASEEKLRSGIVDGYQITGLSENTIYYFSLTAFKDEEIIALQTGSFTTEDNMTTALSSIKEKTTFNIYSVQNTIFVENAQGEHIAVYNTQGQLIASEQNVNGTFKAVVPQAGAYIVRVGGEVVKAAVVN